MIHFTIHLHVVSFLLAVYAVYDIYQGLVVPEVAEDADPVEDNVYINAKRALNDYFTPRRNSEFEIYSFRKSTQASNETIDAYHARYGHANFETPTPKSSRTSSRRASRRDYVVQR